MFGLAALVSVAFDFSGVVGNSYFQPGWHHAAIGRATIACPGSVDRNRAVALVRREYAARPPVKGDGEATDIRILCEKDSRIILASLFVEMISDTEAVYELNDSYEVIGKYLRSPYGTRRWN
jgi:hypothetical protein